MNHQFMESGIQNYFFSNFLTQNANPRADVRTSQITSLLRTVQTYENSLTPHASSWFFGSHQTENQATVPINKSKEGDPLLTHQPESTLVPKCSTPSFFIYHTSHIHHDETFLLFVASRRSLCFRYVVRGTILYTFRRRKNSTGARRFHRLLSF